MFAFVSKIFAPALSPLMIACGLMAMVLVSARRRPRLARNAAGAALVVLLLASNGWVGMLLARCLEFQNIPRGTLPDAEAIVVLSSNAQPALPPQPAITVDDATANRLLYGVQLYHQGKAPVLIISGGRLSWQKSLPPISESMAEMAEMMGVPKSSIVQERDSGNTYQNAVDVKAILKARRFHRILLVTSAVHMPRALALFKHQGIDALAAPCDFISAGPAWTANTADWRGIALGLIPDAANLALTTRVLKEFLGIVVYRLAGRL
jgi:uncharacterized SAM-binding protein YcdF (DUF218 family)